uniref:DYW domain-containing protein n=1 Tax=Opuntia streptacantha TaxID=393608 RepID=A0A7C9EYU5_OPUST
MEQLTTTTATTFFTPWVHASSIRKFPRTSSLAVGVDADASIGYSSKGLFDDAEMLLNQMEEEGIKPNIFTWNSVLSGYSLNGREKDALAVIEKMRALGVAPNVVSWTALISGCSQNEKYKESLDFFSQMLEEHVKPNTATLSSLLQACAGMSWLQKGKEIHCWCIRNSFDEDVMVATALIHMYIKSGSQLGASEIFSRMKNASVATWNCMIMGFAVYSKGREGIAFFNKMREMGIQPDAITFTALLSCCKNSGLLDEGWKYFDSMKADYNIQPTIEHYSCMVDLLGRAGYLDEAWDFIHTMPIKPHASVWGSLLQSCRAHNNVSLGRFAAKNLFELEPNNSANYVIMMNLYSMSGRWEDVEHIKEQMSARGVRIRPGLSWIQINHNVHVFSEEEPHPDAGDIYFELYQLISEMKKLGYIPDVKCVYQDTDDVEKEKVLLTHTEKLAITYGLMKMKNSSPIRVIKTTRTCSDCHTAAKFMSLVRNCEIILKDGVRFHHFRDGRCSCNDYW